jgi:serine/threonine-protein kinase
MGEVYRARDTALERDVALKVLPDAFAADVDRIARFKREAQVLAALNHPGIASIYGFEDSREVHALVMELVEGPTLADRIGEGRPIPVEEALPIARQIAEALEYAHERGIVHRDLKPANVKLTPAGAVKLLDFGLAKALEGEPARDSAASAPTMSRLATEAGLILGTAAYMSPEQAKGKPVDRRTDAWAFGCVLFEMLTGTRTFDGETMTDVLAAVVKEEPDWSRLPPDTPLAVQNLLRRCLHKDARRRLQAIGEARIALEEAPAAGDSSLSRATPAQGVPLWRRSTPWAFAVLMAIVAMFAVTRRERPTPTTAQVMRLALAPPVEGTLAPDVGAVAVVSPDGARTVCVLRKGEQTQLFVRDMDQAQAIPLAGTEGARMPFFSPDGKWVAFFAAGKLKKIAVTGGAPLTIADAADGRGGDWGPNDIILFTPTANSPLERVSSDGGTPEPVTHLTSAPETDSRSHRWPAFLPGGKQALFSVVYHTGNPLDHADIGVVSLSTGTYQILIRGGSFPRYLPDGYIAYAAGTDVLAAPFDATRSRVTGPPVTVLKGVDTQPGSGSAQFSVSRNGTLLYLPDESLASAKSRLVWVDRTGSTQPVTRIPRAYASPRMSPDGREIVVNVTDETPGVWLYDLKRDTLSPLAVEGRNSAPVLTSDGQSVIYNSIRNGSEGLWMRRVDGSGGERDFKATATTRSLQPNAVSPDGRQLAYSQLSSDRIVLMALPLDGNGAPRPLLVGPGNRAAAAFASDGRWIAYVSDESGENEVYVQESSGQGGRWAISSGGGTEPAWSRSGRELFYRSGNKMMAVAVTTGQTFSADKPHALFEGDYGRGTVTRDYDVSLDGRFVMVQPEKPAAVNAAPALQLVLNWFQELRGPRSQ